MIATVALGWELVGPGIAAFFAAAGFACTRNPNRTEKEEGKRT